MLLRIREFDPEKEDWQDYIEQVEWYFVAHDLNEDAKEPTKCAVFLPGVGSTTYASLKSLLAPAKPADKTFDVIVSTLMKHYSPPPSEVVQSYGFSRESANWVRRCLLLWQLCGGWPRTATLATLWSRYCVIKLFLALTMRSFRRNCWTILS